LEEARDLGINIPPACERGLVETIAEARAARWLEENRDALDAWNAWIEANGLPLKDKRLF
jgi:antitoxin CcdA